MGEWGFELWRLCYNTPSGLGYPLSHLFMGGQFGHVFCPPTQQLRRSMTERVGRLVGMTSLQVRAGSSPAAWFYEVIL